MSERELRHRGQRFHPALRAAGLGESQLKKFDALVGAQQDVRTERDEDSAGPILDAELLEHHVPSPPLFDYQLELVESMASILSGNVAVREALLSLPTGAGKTRTAVWSVLSCVRKHAPFRLLWLAPTIELIDQAAETFRQLWHVSSDLPPIWLVRLRSGRKREGTRVSEVHFGTPHFLIRNAGRGSTALTSRPDAIVFDEAHQAAAPEYWRAIEAFRGRDEGRVPLVGLSATPGRSGDSDTEYLVNCFNRILLVSELLGREPVATLRTRGVLASIEFKLIPLPSQHSRLNLRARISDANVAVRSLDQLKERFLAIVELIASLPKGERVLVFAGSVAHAYAIHAALELRHIRTAVVEGRLSTAERRRVISLFAEGSIEVLINYRVLATGYDCPAVRHVVITSPVGSPIVFEQIVGRASRGLAVGGMGCNTVWQFDDHLALHGSPNSYRRYWASGWNTRRVLSKPG